MTEANGRRKTLWTMAAVAVVLLGVAGFLYFRPDKAFVDTEVSDTLADDVAAALSETTTTLPAEATSTTVPAASATTVPATSTTGGPTVVSRGTWEAVEHATTGEVAIVEVDGAHQLVLQDLATDNGPDLKVYLSTAPAADVSSSAYGDTAIDLGPLRGNRGQQVYAIPASVNVAEIRSAAIWCKRFSVGFGAAALAP